MAWGAVAATADRLAAGWVAVQPGDYDPTTGHGPEWGKAAPAGLLIWLFMGVALFFLIKSMNRHMKRVPKTFETAEQPGGAAPSTAADGVGSVGSAGASGSAGESDMTLSSTVPDAGSDTPE